MRIIKLIFLGILALLLISVAMANTHVVNLYVEPFGSDLFNLPILMMPLFMIIFISVLIGMILGIILEWFRERHIRKLARTSKREAAELREELSKATGN